MLKNISLELMTELLDEHAIVSVTDVSGNITYVNQLFLDISGYTEAELLGKNHRILKSGLHTYTFYQEMWDTLLAGKTWHGEVCNRNKGGELYWVRASVKPILDDHGLPIQYISIRTEITEIERAKENSQRSLQLMKTVMNSIPDLIFYKDTEGRYVGCNHPFEKWAGMDEAQLIGKTDFDFVEEKVAAICKAQDEEVVATNKPCWNEEWVSYPDGRKALMEVSKSPYHFGGELSGVIGISHDITRRKQAENHIQESNLRWKFALEGSGDGVWDWNVPNGTVFLSTRWKEMLGFSEDEIGNSLDDCESRYHPDDKANALATLQDYFDGKTLSYACELRVQCKDGSYKWILDRGLVVSRDEHAKPLRMLGTYEDISKRKEDEAQVKLLYRKVTEQKEGLEQAVIERTKEVVGTRLEIVRRLGRACEFRDNETGAHIERMSRYSHLLALKAGLSPEHADLVMNASPMHDVGKIGIPDAILLKPGKLTEEEFEIIKNHPTIGSQILAGSDSDVIKLAELIAYTHHEKWDGTGYPRGLRGEEIPIEGRITAIADVFDALTTIRPYKHAWDVNEAANFVLQNAGTHFDPALAAKFYQALPEMLLIRTRFPDSVESATACGMDQR